MGSSVVDSINYHNGLTRSQVEASITLNAIKLIKADYRSYKTILRVPSEYMLKMLYRNKDGLYSNNYTMTSDLLELRQLVLLFNDISIIKIDYSEKKSAACSVLIRKVGMDYVRMV